MLAQQKKIAETIFVKKECFKPFSNISEANKATMDLQTFL